MTTLSDPIPFPKFQPEGFVHIEEPYQFDPDKHLALDFPDEIRTLDELGYTKKEIEERPTRFAVSSATRMLTEAGALALRETARTLRKYVVHAERIENFVRGGVYRSRFMRDLCTSPRLTEFHSDVFGIPVAHHNVAMHLGQLNYNPERVGKHVDKWHADCLELDSVMMVSDPTKLVGGNFQYFMGTKAEAEELSARGEPIPEDRTVTPLFPAAGYGVVLHGSLVVHRATKLTEPGERITMVNPYVSRECLTKDRCRFLTPKAFDPPHVLYPEWARHKAWIARAKLNRLIEETPFVFDPEGLVQALRDSMSDIEDAIADLTDETPGCIPYYGT